MPRGASAGIATSLFLTLTLVAPGALAAKKAKATPTPTPAVTPVAGSAPAATPSPTPAPSDEEIPTVSENEEEEWGQARGRGMIFGLRGGWHAYDVGGIASDGGPALSFAVVMPFRGSWFLGATLGVHTGYTPAGGDNQKRYFDSEYAAAEGQYRWNTGALNVYGMGGLGVLTANSSDVTGVAGTPNAGAPISVTGFGALLYLGGGAYLPVGGRMGLVGELKYGIAPVAFSATSQTLLMGGLTASVGADFGF